MIMYLTRIDAYAFVTGCGGYSGIYNVIFGIAHIIGKSIPIRLLKKRASNPISYALEVSGFRLRFGTMVGLTEPIGCP